MILKRKLFLLIFSCLTFCTINNCMEVNKAESASEMLVIETSDGIKHTVAKELCLHSAVIRNMLEDVNEDDVIPLSNLSSEALELLVPMLQLIHGGRPEELSSQLNLKRLQELAEFLKASNYLDISQLLDAVSTCIAVKLSSNWQQFCNNKDFLHTNGLTELSRDLSVLIVSKLVDHSGLRVYLLNNCSISGKILEGHTDEVVSAKFNNTGDKVVSASYDGTVRIWDVESGECLRVLEGHTDFVRSAEFDNSGDKVVSASDDGTVIIWDVETGQCLQVLRGHTGCVSSATKCDKKGDKVVSVSFLDKTARILDTDLNCLKVLEGHTYYVHSAEFNNTGDKVVSASLDGTVRIWDISELNAIDRYLQQDLTLEQALFLLCAYEVKQFDLYNQQFDHCPRLLQYYDSLQQGLTFEKGLFLSCAYEAKQNRHKLDCRNLDCGNCPYRHTHKLDCRNCPWLLECYDSLPDCIQRILIKTKVVDVP